MDSTLAEKARNTHCGLDLLGSGETPVRSGGILSPFFQLKRSPDTIELAEREDVAKQPTGRDIPRISLLMIKAFVLGYDAGGSQITASVLLQDTDNTNTGCIGVQLTTTVSSTDATIDSQIAAAINAYCVANGVPTPDTLEWIFTTPAKLAVAVPAGLASAPQAAIANAPADAVTNYNTVTTLLGALTGAVNTANSKQNDIATKLNSLLSELRTLGLIAS